MKLLILLSTMFQILSCQGQMTSNKLNNTNTQEDTIMIDKERVEIEYYDFTNTHNGTQSVFYEKDKGWLVEVWAMNKVNYGVCKEYAPASEFYRIYKEYYLTGMIRERVKFMSGVAFGRREYFDENGNCIKIVDENKKFGVIKKEYILDLLEKEGWFNRETGENIITDDAVLPTNYSFYREITRYITITFKRAVVNNQGKEIEPPKWFIKIEPRNRGEVTNYVIDGNTGLFEKKEVFIPRYE